MNGQFDEFYKKGSKIWGVKEFQGSVLSALNLDLGNKAQNGIPNAVCDEIFNCLTNAIQIAGQIKDGSAIFLPYSSQVEQYRSLYKNWNDSKDMLSRIKSHDRLIKYRKGMNSSIYEEMAKIKTKSDTERKMYYEQLYFLDMALIDRLSTTFTAFANQHPNDFPQLKKIA